MNWQATSLEKLVKFYCSLSDKIPGRFQLWKASKDPSKVVEVTKEHRCFRKVNFMRFAHLLIHSLQAIVTANQLLNENRSNIQSRGISLCFWLTTTMECYICTVFALRNAQDVALIINTLYRLPRINSCRVLKSFMYVVPCTLVGLSFINSILVVRGKSESLTNAISFPLLATTGLKWVFRFYEIWTFTATMSLSIMVVSVGMWSSYVALWVLTAAMYSDAARNYSSDTLNKLTDSLKEYAHLHLYTNLVNSCFQEYLALRFKMAIMSVTIILGAFVIKSGFVSWPSFLLGAYFIITSYGFMAVGYYFPGKTNWISMILRWAWLQKLAMNKKQPLAVVNRRAIKEVKAKIKALPALKLRFGSVNFYERGTALNIMQFLSDKTITVVLLL